MRVDEFFRLRARLVGLTRSVDADPASIGVLSTGEACAVALLLGRLDLLNGKDQSPARCSRPAWPRVGKGGARSSHQRMAAMTEDEIALRAAIKCAARQYERTNAIRRAPRAGCRRVA